MKLDKEAISQRLREFGTNKFGSVKAFAKALNKSPTSLQVSYLSGRNAPGAPMIAKLIELGCNIEWLLMGVKKDCIIENERLKAEIDLYKKQLSTIKGTINI